MSDINYIEIGTRIKKKRKEKELSQSALAEKIGLEYRTLIKWEKGDLNHKIDFPIFLKLCEVLEIDIPYLLGNDYSTKEIETVCTYTGLSEQAAKTLHQFNKSEEVMNIPEFLSDLLDNYENFHFLLFALEDFLVASYNTKASEKEFKKSDFRNTLLWKKYYDASSVALLQCQRAIDSLTDEIENDEYIKRIAEIRKTGYAAIIKEKEQ